MATQGYTGADVSGYEVEGGGWIIFAVSMLGLAGVWNAIQGILAIGDSRVYVGESTFVFSNLNTWGWIILLLGVAQLLAAFAIVSGSEFGRWFGMDPGLSVLGDRHLRDRHPDHLRARRLRWQEAEGSLSRCAAGSHTPARPCSSRS
jgi:hypothetical protein